MTIKYGNAQRLTANEFARIAIKDSVANLVEQIMENDVAIYSAEMTQDEYIEIEIRLKKQVASVMKSLDTSGNLERKVRA
jgi:hypothetical protein